MLWAKLHTDIIGDPKLLRAARKGARHLHWLPWLIAFAKAADDDGRLTVNGEPVEPEDVAPQLPGCTPESIAACIMELATIGVLTIDEDGVYAFAQWQERSGTKASDDPEARNERVRRHRAKKKRERETLRNALHATRGNAIEEEEEKEQEREKESSSSPPPDETWRESADEGQARERVIAALGNGDRAKALTERFIRRCPRDAVVGMLCRVESYLTGTRSRIGGERVTPEHIMAALDDFDTNRAAYNAALLHKYIDRVVRAPPSAGPAATSGVNRVTIDDINALIERERINALIERERTTQTLKHGAA